MSQEVMGPGPGGDHLDHVRDAIGRWIRHHREFLGISQEAFRRRLRDRGVSVSQSTLSRWERGEAAPPLEIVPLLTDALGASLASAEEVLARAARRERIVDLTGRSPAELLDAARRAARDGQHDRTVALCEAALDLALLGERAIDLELRARLLLLLAWAHYNLWHLELARDVLRRATALGDVCPPFAVRRRLLRISVEHRYGDDEVASILATAVENDLDRLVGADRAFALHALGQFRVTIEDFRPAIALLEEASTAWADLEERLESSRSGVLLGYALTWSAIDEARGERLLRSSLEEGDARHFPDVSRQARRLLGRCLLRAGHRAAGSRLLDEAMSLARTANLPEEEFLAAFYAWEFQEGRPREVLDRRLRRLLPRVHPLLPEARRFRDEVGADDAHREGNR